PPQGYPIGDKVATKKDVVVADRANSGSFSLRQTPSEFGSRQTASPIAPLRVYAKPTTPCRRVVPSCRQHA
ncbi:hypothetical protein J8J40_33035, partial [Mycobacterium tuberculosis]|nr:hypothetical protein [Mycobacterium tuberculosis]MBP0651897.1 hypothetical protein [Mycobacterium tuberculosis]